METKIRITPNQVLQIFCILEQLSPVTFQLEHSEPVRNFIENTFGRDPAKASNTMLENKLHNLTKWKGYHEQEYSWQSTKDLKNVQEPLAKYDALKRRPG